MEDEQLDNEEILSRMESEASRVGGLEGVELTDEDVKCVRDYMAKGETLYDAIDYTLSGIADCISEGYDD